ncbi:hypothetical protein HH214_02665 [Mucilaginibacter robiniae]|uniref:Uncharacterized protein n=1 Tax=Mucilaginibacter robiniae TaxID=2728022 RepID=A0A7L5DXM0_9SPHI|nr:hypothetical protein [Mucilaginibacter robiniae]QJD94857.1 hypothetical protein HH214_02665 [Mucilaginibacter robiniae]
MAQEEDQLQQQGEKPYDEKEGLQEAHESGQEIISGANDEDQLAKLKEAAPKNSQGINPENQEGATPDTYLPPEDRH